MSTEIAEVSDTIVTVKMTGKVGQPEFAAAQRKVADIIQKQGIARILFIVENFQGWVRGGNWGDLTFQIENDARIEKIAIVGEKKWEDLALLFAGQGLRRFPIEYFQPAEMARARAWLASD